MTIFETEKAILKAQTPQEIDDITGDLDIKDLRNVIKLLVDRLTPVNVKMNRILDGSWSDRDEDNNLVKTGE